MDRIEEIYQSGKRHKKILKAERKEQVCSTSLEREEKGNYLFSGQRDLEVYSQTGVQVAASAYAHHRTVKKSGVCEHRSR